MADPIKKKISLREKDYFIVAGDFSVFICPHLNSPPWTFICKTSSEEVAMNLFKSIFSEEERGDS
jgi:hypothetical protein